MKKKDWTGIFLTARVQRLYKEYEDNIISGLEAASGLSFLRGFTIVVSDITGDHYKWFTRSGIDRKKATLIEIDASAVIGDDFILWILIAQIGYRLLSQHHIYPPTVEDEEVLSEEWGRLIYSFLIEAVETAFGSQRAKAIIKDGTKYGLRPGTTKAWKWAISMTPKQRKAAWNKLKVSYSHSPRRPANI